MEQKLELNKENIEKAILELAKVNFKTVTIKDLEELLFPFFAGYTINAPYFDPNEITILRGRICSKPKYIEEITYPKPQYVNSYGRVNDIGQSMFYGSIGKSAPFKELNVKVGDTLIMGLWNIKDSMLLNHVGFTTKTRDALKSKRNLQDLYEFVKSTNGYNELNTLVYNYLADIFTWKIPVEETYRYKLSIAIANKLLMGDTFSGVMYPSIALYGNTDNIVLKPEFVDKSLELIAVEYLKITSIDNDIFQYDTLDTATEVNESNEIMWTGRLLTWSSNDSFSAINNGESWVPHDKSGKRMNPKSNGDLIQKMTLLEKRFKKQEDFCIKVGDNFNVKIGQDPDNLDLINVWVNLNFNINNKEKSLSFYMPDTKYCVVIFNSLIQNYKNYLDLDKGNLIEMRDEKTNQISYSTSNAQFNNKITLFSERRFDTKELLDLKPSNLQLEFIFEEKA
ncbi:hypothetical protein AAFN85_21055 [Mucilaginibacter sp. CAU 1740]|uniref:hypothetical protein n=1 Tax=Mucilaginibacter sp. CAU 1740 TaxID=3140365 RepID=UPI00325B0467